MQVFVSSKTIKMYVSYLYNKYPPSLRDMTEYVGVESTKILYAFNSGDAAERSRVTFWSVSTRKQYSIIHRVPQYHGHYVVRFFVIGERERDWRSAMWPSIQRAECSFHVIDIPSRLLSSSTIGHSQLIPTDKTAYILKKRLFIINSTYIKIYLINANHDVVNALSANNGLVIRSAGN